MSLRRRVKSLEHAARGEILEIPQPDGTTARFPPSAGAEAFLALMRGEDHPLAIAARASQDPEWARSFYASEPMDPDPEDLSEP